MQMRARHPFNKSQFANPQVYILWPFCLFVSLFLIFSLFYVAIIVNTIVTAVSCWGSLDGVIDAFVTGGIPPLQYVIHRYLLHYLLINHDYFII